MVWTSKNYPKSPVSSEELPRSYPDTEDGPNTPDEALDLLMHEAGWTDMHGDDHHEDDCPICRSIAIVRAGLNHAYQPSSGVAQAETDAKLYDLASTIHAGRFGPDYPAHLDKSFEVEGMTGREYCFRIARAVMTKFKVTTYAFPSTQEKTP